MTEPTQRDKVWSHVVQAIIKQQSLTTKEIREDTGVSSKIIREVLHVAEDIGYLNREGHSHEWKPVKLVEPDLD